MSARGLDLQRDLLDRQIVGSDGSLLGKVDDLELREDEQGRLQVTALLVGPNPLARRLGRRRDGWLRSIAARLDQSSTPGVRRLDYALVTDVGSAVTVALPEDAEPVSARESWLGDHLIRRIPGNGHESE
jgi:sporulation protein YlmC with PRC-barrel domain